MTQLESQLKTLSASTLSVSSSSSLGSLSTTSSKGSLSSGLSFTDIYGGPQCITVTSPVVDSRPVDMEDLHRRVEKLLKNGDTPSPGRSQSSLSPRSSLSSVSPPVSPLYDPTAPAPPAYEQVERQRRQQAVASACLDRTLLEDRLSELRINQQHIAAQLQHHDYINSVNSVLVPRTRVLPPNISLTDLQEIARGGNMSQGSGLGRPVRCQYDSTGEPPLSPISETPPPLLDDGEELLQVVIWDLYLLKQINK